MPTSSLNRLLVRTTILFLLHPSFAHAQDQSPVFPWRFVKLAELETAHPDALVKEFERATIDLSGIVTIVDRQYGRRDGGDPFLGFHQFGPDGKWIRNLSREGDGPGEFRSPRLIDVTADNGFVVIEGAKVIRITKDSEYMHSFMIARSNLLGLESAGDHCWIIRLRVSTDGPTAPNDVEIELYDNDGNIVWNQRVGQVQTWLFHTGPSQNTFVGIPNPCIRQILWATDAQDRLWLIPPDYQQVWIVDLTGKVTKQPVSLPEMVMERSQWQDLVEDRISAYMDYDLPVYREAANRIRRELRRGWSDIAPGQRMWSVGLEGFLIDRIPGDDRTQGWWRNPGRYIALLPDGNVSAEVTGPGAIVAASYGYVLCRHSEWDALPRLVLYRLEPVGK